MRPVSAPSLETWLDALVRSFELGEWEMDGDMFACDLQPIAGYPIAETADGSSEVRRP